jgi:tRNA pseudouridine32 synthase / 23S rRNA pseudouridine746 synthase
MTVNKAHFFLKFKHNTEGYALPQLFTYPFNYTPHPLSILAAQELQEHIKTQTDWQHDFGFDKNTEGVGKMFGVLVVENKAKELGYLAAFSGKLAGANHHPFFVPPVFDILEKDGFFRKGEAEISDINKRIDALEKEENFIQAKLQFENETKQSEADIKAFKNVLHNAKKLRDTQRNEAKIQLSPSDLAIFEEKCNKESADFYYQLKDLKRQWKRRLEATQLMLNNFLMPMNNLKEERKKLSAALQQRLFDNYTFLNQAGEYKSLGDIFNSDPPSGAGECAAPKLLQYAFLHHLQPICMAEFWWGKSPSSEIRKHGQFYPACKSKCEPILGHMLKGIKMEENTLSLNLATEKELDIVFEDDVLVVVNKPAEFLSVPGKSIEDSVFQRLKTKYPAATGPLIVHRLDMSTSGLLLIAKTKEAHQHLQSQFLKRKVKKRYVAILDGIIEGDEGIIDLPLRVDLDDRPRQLVCYDYGKPAKTLWKVVERKDNKTRVHFFPITGRTHQLRVHAAHVLGLNTPILGDELYGNRADRLYLHAERLEFFHPNTEGLVQFEVLAPF